VVMRVLEGLHQRDMLVSADLNGRPADCSAVALQPEAETRATATTKTALPAGS